MRTRLSNYHKKKRQIKSQGKEWGLNNGTWTLIGTITWITLFAFAFILLGKFQEQLKHRFDIIKPISTISNVYAEEEKTREIDLTQDSPEKDKIENYIKTIFAQDYKIATAISKSECSPRNKLYPACDHTITSKEYSVGIFQINIQSEYAKVHFYRIPGSTLEDKVAWLKNPYNNTLMAYWIFKTSGWFPWSTYLNGAYLNNL